MLLDVSFCFSFFFEHWSGILCMCLYFFDSTVTDKFTESMYVLANEPSVALYRLQEHVRRSLPELVQHKVLTLCHIVGGENY